MADSIDTACCTALQWFSKSHQCLLQWILNGELRFVWNNISWQCTHCVCVQFCSLQLQCFVLFCFVRVRDSSVVAIWYAVVMVIVELFEMVSEWAFMRVCMTWLLLLLFFSSSPHIALNVFRLQSAFSRCAVQRTHSHAYIHYIVVRLYFCTHSSWSVYLLVGIISHHLAGLLSSWDYN